MRNLVRVVVVVVVGVGVRVRARARRARARVGIRAGVRIRVRARAKSRQWSGSGFGPWLGSGLDECQARNQASSPAIAFARATSPASLVGTERTATATLESEVSEWVGR